MRGENQYNHIRRVLFEISPSRGSSECIDFGGNPKDLRSILDHRRCLQIPQGLRELEILKSCDAILGARHT
jgi:hypothetical protein